MDSEGGDAGDALSDDEGMNVVGAFVGFDGFEIHEVSHDGVVVGDAVGAEDVAGHAGALDGHGDVVFLGHGDVLECDFALIFEAADLEGEQLCFSDFGDHPGEFLLDELVAGDGLAAKLFALLGVLQSGVVAGHGCTDRTPTDAVARLAEAHQGGLEAVGAGKQIRSGDAYILHGEAGGDGGAQRPLAVDVASGEAGTIGFDEEAADAPLLLGDGGVFDFGPDDGDVGDAAGGDPHLFSVEDVVVAVFACAGSHASGVGAEVGFGEAEAAEFFAGGQFGKPAGFLLVGAKGVDGVHDECGLDADEAAEAGVAAFQFLGEQAVLDVVEAGTAVAFEGGAEEAEVAHGANEFAGEASVAVALLNDGDEFVFDEGPGVGADEEFVCREKGVKQNEVYALILECHRNILVSGLVSVQSGSMGDFG